MRRRWCAQEPPLPPPADASANRRGRQREGSNAAPHASRSSERDAAAAQARSASFMCKSALSACRLERQMHAPGV
eukprot:2817786-Pleurochrysis_carterae.AAC.2